MCKNRTANLEGSLDLSRTQTIRICRNWHTVSPVCSVTVIGWPNEPKIASKNRHAGLYQGCAGRDLRRRASEPYYADGSGTLLLLCPVILPSPDIFVCRRGLFTAA